MNVLYSYYVVIFAIGLQFIACGSLDEPFNTHGAEPHYDTVHNKHTDTQTMSRITFDEAKADAVYEPIMPENEPSSVLILDKTRIDFRSVDYAEVYDDDIRITNGASAPIEISNILLSGSSDFIIRRQLPVSTLLHPDESFTIPIRYRPLSHLSAQGEIRIELNNGAEQSVFIALSGTAIKHECPEVLVRVLSDAASDNPWETQINVVPNSIVEFKIKPGFVIDIYQNNLTWRVSEKPTTSTAEIMVADNHRSATMIVDSIGDYVVELTVEEVNGHKICVPTYAQITVAPSSGQ